MLMRHMLTMWLTKVGAGAVMSSYNAINGSVMSQNSKALNGLLKTELGFQGYV